jgi:hypothetical protein
VGELLAEHAATPAALLPALRRLAEELPRQAEAAARLHRKAEATSDIGVYLRAHRGATERPSSCVVSLGAVQSTAITTLRIATIAFGTGRQRTVLERWTNPKLQRRTCGPRYGVPPCSGKSAARREMAS